MLEIKNLTIKKIATNQDLVSNLSFVLNQNDKYALIGLEGNGKTTLIKAILGLELDYVEISGSINTNKAKIGYLPQIIKSKWENTNVLDYFLKTDKSSTINPEDYQKLGNLDRILRQVNFDVSEFDDSKNIQDYSGGEIVKLGLAKILLDDPNIIFLDEPTNDLDLKTVIFLENFILNETRPILFISHDEALLENTANGIIHLMKDNKTMKTISVFEKITYKEYVSKRENFLYSQDMIAKKQRSDFKKKMERFMQIYQKVEYRQNQVVRDPSQGRLLKKKMAALKSQEARYLKEKQDFIDFPLREEEINIFFNKSISISNTKVVLDFYIDKLQINGITLSNNINLFIKGPKKIAIIGDNGSGKSTLLKQIIKHMDYHSNLKIGYMSQNYDDNFSANETVIHQLLLDYEKYPKYNIR